MRPAVQTMWSLCRPPALLSPRLQVLLRLGNLLAARALRRMKHQQCERMVLAEHIIARHARKPCWLMWL